MRSNIRVFLRPSMLLVAGLAILSRGEALAFDYVINDETVYPVPDIDPPAQDGSPSQDLADRPLSLGKIISRTSWR